MSDTSYTSEAKSICIDKFKQHVHVKQTVNTCTNWTKVKFKTTWHTTADGVATSVVQIYSADGTNDGRKIGDFIDGKIVIPKNNNAGLQDNDLQYSRRRELRAAIEKLKFQNNVIKLEDIPNLSDVSIAEQVAILRELGFKNAASKLLKANPGELTNTEKALLEAEAAKEAELASQMDIDRGFGNLASLEIEGRTARETYGNYYYPADLVSNKQDRVKFTMGYTEGTKIEATVEEGIQSFQKKLNSITGSVTLPIVTGISDQSSVDWKGAELNPLQSFAAAGALDLFNQAKNNENINTIAIKGGEIIQGAREGLVNSGMGDAINVWLAQKAVGAQNLLSRTTGAIVNPNLEMLFNAPQLRNFGFTFLLSPRDADEADQVRKIIRFFKQGMSVKTTASNVFLKAPNIFNIKYMTYNTDGTEILHPSINIIKTCALLSMDVQYTPNGTYMTYEDPYRTMQAYQLTMQFGELDPIYDGDYTALDNDDDTVIGY